MKWTRGWMIAAVVLVAAAVSVIAATLRQTHARTSGGQTTITWLCPMQLDRPLLERLVAQFRRENPDIDLRLVFVPGAQYQTKLKTLIASGHPPDMFYCGDVWVAYYQPFLLDLTPLFARDAVEIDIDDIDPGVLRAAQTD